MKEYQLLLTRTIPDGRIRVANGCLERVHSQAGRLRALRRLPNVFQVVLEKRAAPPRACRVSETRPLGLGRGFDRAEQGRAEKRRLDDADTDAPLAELSTKAARKVRKELPGRLAWVC